LYCGRCDLGEGGVDRFQPFAGVLLVVGAVAAAGQGAGGTGQDVTVRADQDGADALRPEIDSDPSRLRHNRTPLATTLMLATLIT
jgi:hypothetical protein